MPTGEIVGDRLELRRMLTNLLGNALKFTETGAIDLHLDLAQQQNCLQLTVQDTGIGMAPETQAQIFERFRQGDRKRAGHGLGLYLCRQIVQAHRGTISVQSHLGQGTTFTVTLPRNLQDST